MTSSRGKETEKLFENYWHNLGKEAFLHRFPDTNMIKGILKARGINNVGFIPANPSDYVLTLRGKQTYVEVKSTQNMTSFPFDFTPAQWAGMKKQVAAGGIYTVYVHQTVLDKWYVIDADQILEQMRNGIKSLKWELLEEWSPQCQKKRNTKLTQI